MNKNIKNSISDQITLNYIKNKNIDTLQKVYDFRKALDNDYMQQYLENFDNLVSIYEPNSIIRNLKQESPVCAKIYLSKAYLDIYRISIDKALKLLEAYVHCPYLKANTYNKVPTKYLAIRVQIGLKKITTLINLFKILGFIEVKTDKIGTTYIKVTSEVLNDPWLQEKLFYNEFQNNKAYYIACNINENLYHYKISLKGKNKNIRRSIVEITLAFNHLLKTDPVLHNKYYINGVRTDLIYAICPVKLIAFILGVSEKKVRKELNKLCNKTNFISKHDKMYVDSWGKNHYTNSDYKYFNKETITKDTVFENGHPIIDQDSIMWHEENLEKCKYYKSFKKNMNSIIESVDNALTLYALKDISNLENNSDEEENDTPELRKLNQEEINKSIETWSNGCGSITTLDALEKKSKQLIIPYLPSKTKLDEMTVPRLKQALTKTMMSLRDCRRKAYNRLWRQKQYIEELIKEKIYNYSRDINYKQAERWKEEIEYLTSNQNPKTEVLYDYLEIPLYKTYKEQILEELESVPVI